MSNPEFKEPITWDELVWALSRTRFSEQGSSGYRTLPALTGNSAQHVTDTFFRVIAARRTESGRWENNRLYANLYPDAVPQVYQRMPGGWREIGTWAQWADGDLNTRGFQPLTAGPPAGDGPMTPEVPLSGGRTARPVEDTRKWTD